MLNTLRRRTGLVAFLCIAMAVAIAMAPVLSPTLSAVLVPIAAVFGPPLTTPGPQQPIASTASVVLGSILFLRAPPAV